MALEEHWDSGISLKGRVRCALVLDDFEGGVREMGPELVWMW